jgi:hypothetical protein
MGILCVASLEILFDCHLLVVMLSLCTVRGVCGNIQCAQLPLIRLIKICIEATSVTIRFLIDTNTLYGVL